MTHSHFQTMSLPRSHGEAGSGWHWSTCCASLSIASLGRLSSHGFPSLPALISVAIPVVKRSWKGEIKYSVEKKLFQLTASSQYTFYCCLFNFHNTILYCQIPGRPSAHCGLADGLIKPLTLYSSCLESLEFIQECHLQPVSHELDNCYPCFRKLALATVKACIH